MLLKPLLLAPRPPCLSAPAARAVGPTLMARPAPPGPVYTWSGGGGGPGGRGQPALRDQESVVRREKDGAGARRITPSTLGHTQPGKHESEQKRDG